MYELYLFGVKGCAVVFGGFVWPLLIPVGVIALAMFALRGFVRFRKKVEQDLAEKEARKEGGV